MASEETIIDVKDKREIIDAKWFKLDEISNNGNEEEGPCVYEVTWKYISAMQKTLKGRKPEQSV